MNLQNLSRKEKEIFYTKATTNLQTYWGNQIEGITDFSDLSDTDLERGIKNAISQLRFEKIIAPIGKIIKYLVVAFIVFGIIGLLTFGIKQLF